MKKILKEFQSTFTGQEDFLSDHKVKEVETLPGVAYIEMARSGGEIALNTPITGLRDIVWLTPIQINQQSLEVTSRIFLDQDEVKYEIGSPGKDKENIHSQGKILSTELSSISPVDLEVLRRKFSKEIPSDVAYEEFKLRGLNYGKSFQGIKELWSSETEALTRISVATDAAYILAPGVLDSALQSCMGINFKLNHKSLELPFSIKSLNIHGPLTGEVWCYTRLSKEEGGLKEYDLDLLDSSGNVLVQIQGFVAVKIAEEKAGEKESKIQYYAPTWIEEKGRKSEREITSSDQIILLNATSEQAAVIDSSEDWKVHREEKQTTHSLFELVKEKIVSAIQSKEDLNLTLVGKSNEYAQFGFIRGVMKSAAQEYPKFKGRILAVESETFRKTNMLTECLKNELHTAETEIKYEEGKRQIRILTTVNQAEDRTFYIRSNRSYLITGGVGGLGILFAHHLSKQTSGKIVLTGRSELNAEKQAKVDAIPNAIYISSDVTSHESVSNLVNKIQSEYGALAGVLHGAGVLRDGFLMDKTEEDSKAVFGPKVRGLAVLDEATKSIELDFICCFSSVSAILGNVGQTDYSAANAFMDDYVTERNKQVAKGYRYGKTVSINWPLWRSGGMQIDASSEKYLKRHWGMEPLPTKEGTQALDFILKNNLEQILVLHGDKQKIENVVPIRTQTSKNTIQPKVETMMNTQKVTEILIAICADFLKLDAAEIDAETELSDYGLDSILMMKLLSAMEDQFSCTLDPTVVIQYPTIAELTDYLFNEGLIKEKELIKNRNIEVEEKENNLESKGTYNGKSQSKIAIIGMSCKLPESDNLDEFWEQLKAGKDLIKDVPKGRWQNEQFYSETPSYKTAYTRKGGFMKNPGLFDADYFKIKDHEAISMDPQQRIILELTRDLIANAGYQKEELSNTDTGIFIGAKDNNYLKNGYDFLPENAHQHTIVNSISNMIAARVSDFYNLKGVSQIVDTACSSSLVAIHNACEAILMNKMEMAIAGGISVMVDEHGHVGFSQAKVLSEDGKSFVFDERANGFVMGEGGGLILLKNYDKAIEEGDNIVGVITASSINNDGRTMGLTVPNKEGQKAVVKETLEKSGRSADQISYYEAHGTGTLLGDPIEINAASEVYQTQTNKTGYCAIGSVKSNVGHTMTAAGVTGVLKILLQLKHRELVPTLNCEKPHPRFKFDSSPFFPITENKNWNTDLNIAAISSFGFGGTNCNLMIEESPQDKSTIKRASLQTTVLSQNYYWLGHEIIKENLSNPKPDGIKNKSTQQKSLKGKVIQFLQQRIADKLQVDPVEVLIDEGFMDVGLDSTVLIQMTTEWEEELKIDLYPTLLFQYDNIEKFAGYLSEEHKELFQKMFIEPQQEEVTPVRKEIVPKKKIIETSRKSSERKEEIAIVGITGRYPGAETIDEFWNNLEQSKDSIVEIPKDRWNWEEYFGDEKKERGKTKAKYGGFIKDVDKFDRKFFRVLPLEAQLMDPQHRLALEEMYHLFEDAGMAPESVKGSNTGVFMGVSSGDYGSLLGKEKGLREYAQYATGNTHSILANRISYLFDLHGPSQPIDTACSSSLIAIHRAVEAIQSGNCDMAVAGGVNIIASPELSLSFSQAGMLSEDGRCKTFDQSANGYVRSEGIGMILLKPLSQAKKEGDQIYGVIKGSSENHGGKVNTLTSPNPNAQCDLIVNAYEKAGINPTDITYVEAHGTGTPLGDPIETDALKRAFDKLDEKQEVKSGQCGIGSVKSNIGHLEAAAGIAGITKVLLCLKHKKLPGNPHLNEPNHLLNLTDSPIRLVKDTEDWLSENENPRIAGVSGFGFGGANAHVILEEYQQNEQIESSENNVLICLSAKLEGQLLQKQKDLLNYLENTNQNLADIAYTLQVGRDEMSNRSILISRSKSHLIKELKKQLENGVSEFTSRKTQTTNAQDSEFKIAELANGIEEVRLRKDWSRVAKLWLDGLSIDWKKLYSEEERRKVSLPLYPFAKTRCWYDDLLKADSLKSTIPVKKENKELETHRIGDEIGVENLGDGIVVVKMQAKSTKNMLNGQLINSLEKTFIELEKRSDLKVVILTGYDNVFCMGGSQDILAGIANNQSKYTDAPFVYKGLLEFKVPVISAMQGIAVGGGLIFGLYADLVFMSEKATYSSNFMKYGFTPGMGATYIMPQKFGHQLAQEMMYSAKLIGGKELKERGASVKITSDVMKEAIKAAKELAAKPRIALEVLKSKMAGRTLSELDTHVTAELEMHDKTFHTEEVKALIASHFQKNEATIPIVESTKTRGKDEKVKLIDPQIIMNNQSESYDVNYVKKVKLSAVNEHKVKLTSPTVIPHQAPKAITKNIERVKRVSSIEMNPSSLIKTCISGILHLPEDELSDEGTFLDLGIDSISGVELIRTVNEKFDLQLETVILYDYPTILQLAAHISEKVPTNTKIVREFPKQEIEPELITPKIEVVPEKVIDQSADVLTSLKHVFERILNLPADEISDQEAFIEFGVDSISGVEVVRAINEKFDLSLEAVILYDYSNLKRLAEYIANQSPNWKEERKEAVPKLIRPDQPEKRKETPIKSTEKTQKKREYSNDDIAIIGMSGRFPKAKNTAEFWNNLADGINGVEEVPSRKWSTKELYSPIKGEVGKSYGKWMGAIEDEDKFDAYFFNISPLEAKKMDPQQRIFLEEVWKTFEDAGYAGDQISESSCGVYVGVGQGDYFDRFKQNELLDNHVLTGVTTSMLAARISYLLNLQGPAIAIDTACSSSLVAIHQACQSIRSGDCEMAIAGGANIMTTESMHIMTSRAEMLSEDGKCHTFDTKANGFVPGEAVSAILLKPLSKAIEDGDNIHAVIKGSGTNQDGKTNGIMAPSANSQARLMNKVYEKFKIDAASISLIEAHGTGTKLGDPIEIKALKEVHGSNDNKTCALGSVKTNIGHGLTAAGISGLIKVILAMKAKQIPPSLNYQECNEHIKLEGTPFFVNTALKPWKNTGRFGRRASISSFGYSGTNAHVVLEEYEDIVKKSTSNEECVFVFSAKNEERLRIKVEEFKSYVQNTKECNVRDIAFTLLSGREEMIHRVAIIAQTKEELLTQIECYLLRRKGRYGEANVRNKNVHIQLDLGVNQTIEEAVLNWLDGRKSNLISVLHLKDCRRVSLPTYPFEKERFWVERKEAIKTPTNKLGLADEWKSTKTLSPELAILRDHRVNGRKIVPGVLYLQWVKDAINAEHGINITAFNAVKLLAPIYVDNDSVELQLEIQRTSTGFSYMISSISNGKFNTNAQGNCTAGEEEINEKVDLKQLESSFYKEITGLETYQIFNQLGLQYGELFNKIKRLKYSNKAAFGLIETDSSLSEEVRLGLLDSCLQTCLGINVSKAQLRLPYSIDNLTLRQPLPSKIWSYAQKELVANGKTAYSVKLYSESGECIGEFKTVVVLPIPSKPTKDIDAKNKYLYVPKWKRIKKNSAIDTSVSGTHLIIGGKADPDFAESLRNHLTKEGADVLELDILNELPSDVQHVYMLNGLLRNSDQYESIETMEYRVFRSIKKLQDSKFNQRGAELTVFTCNTQKVTNTDEINPNGSGIIGTIGSLAKEQPTWKIRMIDLDCKSKVNNWDALFSQSYNKSGAVVAYRNTFLFQSELLPWEVDKTIVSKIQTNGTYVLLGGAGGIGRVTSKYLIEKYNANVIWLGRRAKDARIEQSIKEVSKGQNQPVYVQCDATKSEDLKRAYGQIKEAYDKVNGIFHSAIVLNDRLIKNMDEKDFKVAFEPKAIAAYNLLEAFKKEQLDFVCFYSSIQSQVNAPGQSNYAAGCTYKDSYAHALQQQMKNTNIYTINWGYWGEVGVVASKEYNEKLAASGLGSINASEGMEILENVLAGEQKQLAAIKFINS